MLWKSDKVEVSITEQEIHAVVEAMNSNSSGLFTAIYASPMTAERHKHILWENLNEVVDLHNMPWVAGDAYYLKNV